MCFFSPKSLTPHVDSIRNNNKPPPSPLTLTPPTAIVRGSAGAESPLAVSASRDLGRPAAL
jgi:hypothetical protein